jgi:hypothetical protein
MLSITTTILSGGGTVPKDIDLGSVVQIDASSNSVDTYEWTILSKPNTSAVILEMVSGAATKVGPLDIAGVYVVKLETDKFGDDPQMQIVSLHVPASISPAPTAPDPLFDTGGNVRNYSFELPATQPGYADEWGVSDSAGVLDSEAGVYRGRIIPSDFTVTSGTHVMCLGSDVADTISVSAGETFEVSQEVDLTRLSLLSIQIKFSS